ncbi:MAG: YjbH domain-containing protein [Deltaproteobacteria bacterium]|nr:YjbH domain-containing protein [Deltaproteobacteria bacterium]
MPVADALPSGKLHLDFHDKRDIEAFPETEPGQWTFAAGFGVTSFLTLSGRGAVAEPTLRDGSANLHALLLDEGSAWPALAVGVTDVGGSAVHFQSVYAVLSKTWLDLARTTIGVGSGPSYLEGFFAGLEVTPWSFVSFVAEWDSKDPGVGLRLFPMPRFLEVYGLPRPSLELAYTRESGAAFQLGLAYELGEAKFEAQRRARESHRYVATSSDGPALLERLEARGFENVLVALSNDRLFAEVENRRFNRNKLDGFAVAVAECALLAPTRASTITVVLRQSNVAVLALTSPRAELLDFLSGRIPPELFADLATISSNTERPTGMTWISERANGSAFHLDLTAWPRVELLALTEDSALDYRLTVVPEATMTLTPGLRFDARLRLPAYQTTQRLGPLGDVELERLSLAQTVRIPLEPLTLVQLTAGKFDDYAFGASLEAASSLLDGALELRGIVGRLGVVPDAWTRWYATASARLAYAPWDTALDLTAGEFARADSGFRVEVSRFFGTTEVAAFITSTSRATQGGLGLRVPLTLPEELAPYWVRPKLPELARYQVSTTLLEESGNTIRRGVGELLAPELEIFERYGDRHRLTPAWLRAHLDEFRDAVRYFVEPTYSEAQP